MKYELAKQLSDAGFKGSAKKKEEVWLCRHGNDTCKSRKGNRHYWMHDCAGVWNPPLSELIEACGDDFYSLAHSSSGFWIAENCQVLSGKALNGERKEALGQTPEEAVAKLYLKLNGQPTS